MYNQHLFEFGLITLRSHPKRVVRRIEDASARPPRPEEDCPADGVAQLFFCDFMQDSGQCPLAFFKHSGMDSGGGLKQLRLNSECFLVDSG